MVEALDRRSSACRRRGILEDRPEGWVGRSPLSEANPLPNTLKRAAGCIPQMGYAVNLHGGIEIYTGVMLAKSTSTAPVCPACAKPMELVARIEAEGGLPAVEGYHCDPCDTDLVIEVE